MKILLVQVRRVGDTLLATPLIRLLKSRLPASTVHVLSEPASAVALANNPNVDLVIHSPGGASLRVLPHLRRERYDAVIDALGTPASARLTWLTGAPMRIGLARRWRTWWYTRCVSAPRQPEYSARTKLRLAEPLGLHGTDIRLDLYPTHADEDRARRAWTSLKLDPAAIPVAFSPVSRRADKVWPADRYAEVCDRWRERAGLTFVPVVGPGEAHYVERVLNRVRHRDAFVPLEDTLPFGALGPFMRRCAFYFGQDNGIRHVAVAAGLPTAAIFAHPDPRDWTPPDDPRHRTAGGNGHAATATTDDVQQLLEDTVANVARDTRARE